MRKQNQANKAGIESAHLQLSVVVFLCIHQLQRLQCLALNHLKRGLFLDLTLFNLPQNVAERRHDDTDNLKVTVSLIV